MTPSVLLIIFNRFDTTRQVLESLRIAGVKNLYIYSDGPRESVSGELEQLKKVQLQVLSEINWPCQVTTNFESTNLGPRLAIGKGISWFFSLEEEGIILEHDCVPNQTFYRFCSELLEKYRHDERIMHISGDNFQFGKKWGSGSYYFSRIAHIWGWATWKRAWNFYDVEMKSYSRFKEQKIVENIFMDKPSIKFWKNIFEECASGKVESWDYQWNYAMFCQNALSILPNVNLVSNVGFDAEALNTIDPESPVSNISTVEMETIEHPEFFREEHQADSFTIRKIVSPGVFEYFLNKFIKLKRFK